MVLDEFVSGFLEDPVLVFLVVVVLGFFFFVFLFLRRIVTGFRDGLDQGRNR
ncbi:MAG: hypothetical protein ABEJ40_10550 [Haloarculaceae archaeon]